MRIVLVAWLCNSHVALAEYWAEESDCFNNAKQVATGLSSPWGLALLPNNEVLITEQPGRIRRIVDGQLRDGPEIEIAFLANLLDIKLHPEFDENSLIYLSYMASSQGGYGLEVLRAVWSPNQLSHEKIIFRAEPKTKISPMTGGQLLFLRDGSLLISVGDSVRGSFAQDDHSHLGKIIRTLDDGSIPDDNPFVAKEADPAIYSYGLRNVQGLSANSDSEQVFATDHGPVGGDELNLIRPGGNYGWPVKSLGLGPVGDNYEHVSAITGSEFTSPIASWSPAIAPSGMSFYSDSRLPDDGGTLFWLFRKICG